ncbi:MAG: Fe-S protein assembly co-chaperone HscB [Burkholderiaceae bacterium]
MEALKRNHFEFFGLPVTFDIDEAALQTAFKRIQSTMHPDRFVKAGQAERRYAMQVATQANEAFQVLRQPLSRARYLCTLNGVDVGAESNTAMPPAFLVQQMAWRESLDEIRDAGDKQAMDALTAQLRQQVADIHARIADLFAQGDVEGAALAVREWMFLDKLGAELKRVQRQLNQGA